MSDVKTQVETLSRSGVLLSDIIMSESYSKAVREEALRVFRWNVANLHRLKTEVNQ